MDNQEDKNNSQENNNPSAGSILLYLFIIFGIVVMVAIAIGSFYIDIHKGVTHACPKSGTCHDIYLKDSPDLFYLQLFFNGIKVLVFPTILGFFVKKWIDSQ